MEQRHLYYYGKAIEFNCEVINGNEVHLNTNQARDLINTLVFALSDTPSAIPADKKIIEEPMKPKPELKQEIVSKPIDKIEPKTTDKEYIAPDFTEIQIESMKKIKTKLNINDNTQLNQFVRDCFVGQIESYKDLNEKNIDQFIAFMKAEGWYSE